MTLTYQQLKKSAVWALVIVPISWYLGDGYWPGMASDYAFVLLISLGFAFYDNSKENEERDRRR